MVPQRARVFLLGHRTQSKERFVSVFSYPHDVEVRSYYRGDITLNTESTIKRLASQEGMYVANHPGRMHEVQVEGETLEVFIDGRMRSISTSRDSHRLTSIVEKECFILKFRRDFFNALNRVGLGNPDTDVSSSRFGRITGGAYGPRNTMLSLRLDF